MSSHDLRPANVMDVAGYTGVIIGALSDSPLWWLIGLIGLGLILLSDRLVPDTRQQPTSVDKDAI
jgi:hypothetical protein